MSRTFNAFESLQCCEMSEGSPFTFVPGTSGETTQPTCTGEPGTQNIKNEGTVLRTEQVADADICCQLSSFEGVGWTYSKAGGSRAGTCQIFSKITGNSSSPGTTSGTNPKRVEGKCSVYSAVTGNKTVKGAVSGGNRTPAGKVVLWPSWPASSPWVTAVGATRFQGQKASNAEMATDQFGSGGGFSKLFGQSPNAKWQSADVANYLKVVPKGLPFPPTSSFPATGRATPDVSALGEGFQVIQQGRTMPVGGTSASAPTFAGLVSLLNEARLQKGGKAMGFLNPFLYQNAESFTDVTVGTNAIGRGTGPIKYGFNCTEGWDPATGLGTPNFDKLLAAATKDL